MEVTRREPQKLSESECLRLLRRAHVGRLAISSGAVPVILAVDYSMTDAAVLVRTAESDRIKAATDRAVVAFEASGVEDDENAWSVSIAGIAREASADELDPSAVDELPHWLAPYAERVVAISIDRMTGHRVALELDVRDRPAG